MAERGQAAGQSAWGAQRVLGIALVGAGVVGAVIGTVFSFKAKSLYDESTAGPCTPSNICTQVGLDERSDARSMATAATVALGLGVGAIAGGAVVFFTAPTRVPAITVTPSAWLNGVSVTASGAF
jgi:hypothetical protein